MTSLGLTEYGQELIETTIRHMSSLTMEIGPAGWERKIPVR